MAFDFDRMVDEIADAIAERALEKISQRIHNTVTVRENGARTKTLTVTDGQRSSALRGRKLNMACRYPGCKNRSKGPRFRFMCEKHAALPKAEQLKALEKWKEAQG